MIPSSYVTILIMAFFLLMMNTTIYVLSTIVEILWIWTPLWTLYTCGWVVLALFLVLFWVLFQGRDYLDGGMPFVVLLGYKMQCIVLEEYCYFSKWSYDVIIRTCHKNHHMSQIKFVTILTGVESIDVFPIFVKTKLTIFVYLLS